MKSTQLKSALVGLALAFTPALYAHADCRHRTELAASDEGAAIGASGNAEARQRSSDGGNRERFKVQVEADVADGTMFSAFADGQFAGSVITALGRGELELDTEDSSLPDELRPVCNLSIVEVTDENGTLVLSGNLQ
jgi:hypothetical protein